MTLQPHRPDSTAADQPQSEQAQPASLHSARVARNQRVARLLEDMSSCRDQTRRRELANQVVLACSQMAQIVAARYRNRGVEQADLEQIATLGLIKAVHRWEPGRCDNFLQYAVPTMTGEIKRYFRDRTGMIRPHRRTQEIRAAIQLVREHNPAATTAELADQLQVKEADVTEALQAAHLTHPWSLDTPAADGREWAEVVGHDDTGFSTVEDRLILRSIFSTLTDQERTVVRLRFWEDLTQLQIADRIGVSQMQVSRILRWIGEKARHQVSGELSAQAG